MRRRLLPLAGLLLLACASRAGRAPSPGPTAAAVPAATSAAPLASAMPGAPAVADPARNVVPVSALDPSWGSAEAPVTVVVWSDFQCPFCARAAATVEALRRHYGPERLRVVWKNLPLPFHPHARPAAEAAMAVFELAGSTGFWKFHDLAFADQNALGDESYVGWAAAAGVGRAPLAEVLAAGSPKAKVDQDVALAARLGIQGTPVFRINGLPLEGAQPEGEFRSIIDAQLAAAQALLDGGIEPAALYATLCARNAGQSAAPTSVAPAPAPPPEDATVWSVPVERDDPVRGPDDAAVTLVLFSDFECSFCQRFEVTVGELLRHYGADLRVVWKDFPLPFHRQAVPAAVLARLAADRQGKDGFWRAHDAMMGRDRALDEAALKAVAARVGLPWFEVQAAVADQRFRPVFERSAGLAKQLEVRGTPCAFVNGRRIEGARPLEDFVTLIDRQLAKARDLLESGQPRASLYAALTRTPEPEPELARATVAPPTRDNPTLGSAKAPVTIQVFGDFQCPQTLRLMPKLAEVEKEFAGRVRVVWRHHPLVFHEDAALAAEAAQEVFAQKGAAGFWRYHDLLFAAQRDGGLGRDQLAKLARKLGVEGKRFAVALDTHKHRRAVERDVEAATAAELSDVPTVLINGYVVTGVEPVEVFQRVVRRALAESPSR